SEYKTGAGAARAALPARRAEVDFREAEEIFARLLVTERLDEFARPRPPEVVEFARALEAALALTYAEGAERDDSITGAANVERAEAAHLFLQRVLYRVNRLKLFWYDDLYNYENERSEYLRGVRERVESAWQRWESAQLDAEAIKGEDVREALVQRAAEDVAPAPSACGLYFRDEVGEAGYRRLLAVASLDGLVEASQLSRTLGGVSNEIHAVMTKLLVEEYGGGRTARKHSTFFTSMLTELGMSAEPEAYFRLVPWEVLAAINHSFLLSERKRFYLRYVGGLLYTEVSVPAAFENYRAAAERLGMSEKARGYWELHIREDERHGRWMLEDVALPLAAKYPSDAWEIVFGYDQQKLLSGRAGLAVERAAREAERAAARVEEAGKDEAAAPLNGRGTSGVRVLGASA
ncbi:MAG TPA: iron-containing redox enzyme family protein, partial [Pyrinomonadaceae bacterium]|nr:iron-containing redox enzyme family protein [Pyrinomonadaceae bacterium]